MALNKSTHIMKPRVYIYVCLVTHPL